MKKPLHRWYWNESTRSMHYHWVETSNQNFARVEAMDTKPTVQPKTKMKRKN